MNEEKSKPQYWATGWGTPILKHGSVIDGEVRMFVAPGDFAPCSKCGGNGYVYLGNSRVGEDSVPCVCRLCSGCGWQKILTAHPTQTP